VLIILALSLVLSVGAPMVFWIFRKPSWVAPNAAAYLESGEDEPEEAKPAAANVAAPAEGGAH
jgi:hypothetical protein